MRTGQDASEKDAVVRNNAYYVGNLEEVRRIRTCLFASCEVRANFATLGRAGAREVVKFCLSAVGTGFRVIPGVCLFAMNYRVDGTVFGTH